ncbi:hypothetical protein D3C75_866090 [compost metagenome]
MQKYTSPAMYKRGSRNTWAKPPRVLPGCVASAAASACFCSELSQVACAGLSVSQNQPNIPSTMAGMPVSTNSICQSRNPSQPWRLDMITPASGPQMIPAKTPDIMNAAVIRPRKAAGNQ